MARYWLGVCYYYGYGVPKNRTIANEYFSTELDYQNPQKPASDRIEQQELLLQQFKQQQTIQTIQEKIIEDQQLLGNWEGSLFVMDWSDNQIEQEIPIEINFTKNEDLLQSIWEINNNSHQNDFTRIDNTLFYDDFFASIAHTSFKKEIPSTLVHQITETTFSIQKKDAQTYLTANIKSNINQWNEKGAPIRLLLTKKATTEKQPKQESLAPMALEQSQNFLQLYPNPFEKDLTISYELNRPQYTTLFLEGSFIEKQLIKPTGLQNKGSYNYTFKGENLKVGTYILTLITDDKKHTKIVIKN
ncbi:SEL1-like repeat protein [Tenacibaculum sp. C7A-26P2]|uniref:SEL1-like repeat protein n=1 Tax=Tenacibaculum sp. C7A-26P2 TaxID=3447504 RepID=UPI003F857F76